jgi:hypothetical protein
MTPVEIEVLMYYYFMPNNHSRISTPAVKEALGMWTNAGILKPDTKNITLKGQILVKMLCNTPMPIKIWADPRKE